MKGDAKIDLSAWWAHSLTMRQQQLKFVQGAS